MDARDLLNNVRSKFSDATFNRRFLVVGDLMVDTYVRGAVERISPEAPVPVFDELNIRRCPGGAANVASNLAALGADVTLVGRVGNDSNEKFLSHYFRGIGRVDAELIPFSDYFTEEKTRYVSEDGQQVLRVDRRTDNERCSNGDFECLNTAVATRLKYDDFDGIVVADYNKGGITREIANALRQTDTRCYVDCKPSCVPYYSVPGCNHLTMKPNREEFMQMGGELDERWQYAPSRFRRLSDIGADELLITLGRDGISLLYDHTKQHMYLPAFSQEVYNVTGAGDTVMATYARFHADGFTPVDSALLANVAASVVVKRSDTSAVTYDDLVNAVTRYAEGAS